MIVSWCFVGASLVSVEDLAEANFLAHNIEPLEEKSSTFWTGMYRNVDGNFFSCNTYFQMNICHKDTLSVKYFTLHFGVRHKQIKQERRYFIYFTYCCRNEDHRYD